MQSLKRYKITPFTWQRILTTVFIIAVSSLIRLLFFSDLGRGIPYLTYYPAVMLAAIFGGLIAGLLGTTLSSLLCFFWIQQGHLSPVETLALIVFILSCTMISFLAEAMRIARTRAKVAQLQAETANKAKSVFLANISHELRTPLNAILGYSQLMQREADLRPELQEYLRIINRSGEHLLSLINDVLEIAKIEAGKVILEPVNFNIRAMIEDIRKMFWEKIDDKSLEFTIAGMDSLPRFIVADQTKLRIVLINLLGNAVKFTQKGGVTLRLSLKKQNPEELFLLVEVEDTGPGIAASDMDKLFNYFVQTESGLTSQSGTGLGLAISRDYVRLMGGVISATSKPGEGSTFRFTARIEEGRETDSKVVSTARRVKGLKAGTKIPRVLVAEDIQENRNLLAGLLREVGFEVRTAQNGKVAVDIFNQWHPDFIWMDIRMPVMDGKEASRIIKASEGGKLTRIAALSAHVLGEEREEILASGCDDFVGKPYRETEVFDIMAKHLFLHYIYEDQPGSEPVLDLNTLNTLDLSTLDVDMLKELKSAVDKTDAIRIGLLAKRLTGREPDIATVLQLCAGNFDYDTINKALRRVPTTK